MVKDPNRGESVCTVKFSYEVMCMVKLARLYGVWGATQRPCYLHSLVQGTYIFFLITEFGVVNLLTFKFGSILEID